MALKALQDQIARTLLSTDALVFTPHEPITFKSGIRSPVYVDNRRLPYWPEQWHTIIEGFQQLIALKEIAFDLVAGIAVGGILHSAALAYVLQAPSVFVRKQPKEHGTRSAVEGGGVERRTVLLIEDLVTTGGSSLAGVQALRDEGAKVTDCLCITWYGFAEAQQAFEKAQVRLHPLVSFSTIVIEAAGLGRFSPDELDILEAWARDPHAWGEQPEETDRS
jgi:orotate phosphoribosyltransferase